MKFFQSIEDNFAAIGINSYQSKKQYPFNAKCAVIVMLYGLNVISTAGYPLHVANDFGEYVYSAFSFFGATVCCVSMLTIILMTPKLFKFLSGMDKIVKKSELKSNIL